MANLLKQNEGFRMKASRLTAIILVLAGVFVGLEIFSGAKEKVVAPKKKLQVSIQPRHMADALRALVQGHREEYIKAYAQGMAKDVPCQFFRKSAETVASKGVEFSYVLRSLHPIATRNLPETEFERKGIEAVTKNPEAVFCGEELLGGRWYFTAVYPDVAFNRACIDCHNQYKDKTGKLYKQGDVIGALIIRIALEL